MDNMEIYNAVRAVPETAKSPIENGRLKGKTNINPMWRIKVLTERFGPCGIGWAYTIDRQWMETGAKGELTAFVNISLRVRIDGEWSEPIPGSGGSPFVANERSGPHTSDECYKMALTDAISVACKALGVGADVYWDEDKTKYTALEPAPEQEPEPEPEPAKPPACDECGKPITQALLKDGSIMTSSEVASRATEEFGRPLCAKCQISMKKKKVYYNTEKTNDRAAG